MPKQVRALNLNFGTISGTGCCPYVRLPGRTGDRMFKPISISRPIVRTAAVACVATVLGLAITASPGAGSRSQDASTQSYALANPDRVRVPARGNGCSAPGWPNFEPKCRFDLTE